MAGGDAAGEQRCVVELRHLREVRIVVQAGPKYAGDLIEDSGLGLRTLDGVAEGTTYSGLSSLEE